MVSTVAGSGAEWYADGVGTNAMFTFPHGVAVDSWGTLYVADFNINRIRKISTAGTANRGLALCFHCSDQPS